MRFQLMSPEHGHETIDFDKLDPAAMKSAEELFNTIQARGERLGETPARTPGAASPELVKNFNPDAESYTTVRPIVGG